MPLELRKRKFMDASSDENLLNNEAIDDAESRDGILGTVMEECESTNSRWKYGRGSAKSWFGLVAHRCFMWP